jgi:hypothetical protein
MAMVAKAARFLPDRLCYPTSLHRRKIKAERAIVGTDARNSSS